MDQIAPNVAQNGPLVTLWKNLPYNSPAANGKPAAAQGLRNPNDTRIMYSQTFPFAFCGKVIMRANRSGVSPISQSCRGQIEKSHQMFKPSIRANELADFFGSAQLAEEIVKDGWIKPVVDRHSCVIYDRADCVKAWNRLKNGEEPKRISRKRKGGAK